MSGTKLYKITTKLLFHSSAGESAEALLRICVIRCNTSQLGGKLRNMSGDNLVSRGTKTPADPADRGIVMRGSFYSSGAW